MLRGRAFLKPIRKVFQSIIITALFVVTWGGRPGPMALRAHRREVDRRPEGAVHHALTAHHREAATNRPPEADKHPRMPRHGPVFLVRR